MTKNTKKVAPANVSCSLAQLSDFSLDSHGDAISSVAFSISIRSLLNQWRQGTVSCKDRSEVAKSGKKPWKQKGTGRARAGTARSPLWRGGGVIHGPQPRVKVLSVNKKMRKSVFELLLRERISHQMLHVLKWSLEGQLPQTKQAYSVLGAVELLHDRVLLFLNQDDHVHYSSFSNLNNVRIIFFDEPNVYDLAMTKKWIFLEKDTDHFKKMVSRWL